MMDQLIFTDEAAAAGVPVPFLTINTVGPTIMRFGTAEQKAFYLPRIAAGELHFSIGYSEPEAGTDLARCAPARSGTATSYVINGQKMWTSLIQYADYVWLACRTDPDAPRHKGLSIIIVPTDARRLLLDAGAHHGRRRPPAPPTTPTCGCRPPPWSARRTSGWPLITNQLNHERVALTSAAPIRTALREVRDVGPRHQAGQRPAGHRRRMGAGQPGPGARQGRVPQADSTGGSRRRPGPASARRRPRPPRCSAPSSPPRRTGC